MKCQASAKENTPRELAKRTQECKAQNQAILHNDNASPCFFLSILIPMRIAAYKICCY